MRHRYWRLGKDRTVEAYTDWTCWMVGVNFAHFDLDRQWAIYLHVGPLIVGTYPHITL